MFLCCIRSTATENFLIIIFHEKMQYGAPLRQELAELQLVSCSHMNLQDACARLWNESLCILSW